MRLIPWHAGSCACQWLTVSPSSSMCSPCFMTGRLVSPIQFVCWCPNSKHYTTLPSDTYSIMRIPCHSAWRGNSWRSVYPLGSFVHSALGSLTRKYFAVQCSPIYDRALLCSKVARFRPLVLLVRATCGWRWLWSKCGMILTGENWSTGRESCHSATLSTTNLTRTDLGSNSDLGGEKLATNNLRHVTAA